MFLTEDQILYLPHIKEEIMDYEKIVQDLDLHSENMYKAAPLNEGRKRMRLHQLSWEEKIQRKKLRNRVAAQTSRDRKKAKMEYLEESVKSLKLQNDLLCMKLEELEKRNEMLLDANKELQKALAERSHTCLCLKKVKEEEKQEVVEEPSEIKEQICIEDGYSFERPAESSEFPQQKGHRPTSAQKCWQISKETHSLKTLKDWHQVCWRKLNSMRIEESQSLYSKRFQELAKKNASTIMKWWGKHQKNWNPVEVK